MSRRRTLPPADGALERGLSVILGGGSGHGVRVLTRAPNGYASFYASEIVDCARPEGTTVRVHVKYGPSATREHGQRLGAGYEAVVCRDVLRGLPLTTAAYYGAHAVARTGETWLVTEHIADALPASRGSIQLKGMTGAAAWIGRFHALSRGRAVRLAPQLNHYDRRYMRLWAQRTLRFEGAAAGPWLGALVKRFETAIDILTSAPQRIIHGDYYADNVLYQSGRVYPIDWERAGIGPGEIDLAALLLGWHDELVEACVRSYSRARWPQGAPHAFPKRFTAAQLYVLFRLLGEGAGWPEPDMRAWRLDLLRAAGERLGLLGVEDRGVDPASDVVVGPC